MPDRPETRAERLALAQHQHRRAQRELHQVALRLVVLMVALALLVVAGAVAFMLVDRVSLGFGFVRTLDTVTTLGSVPAPGDTGGRLVVVGLELLGIGTLFYGLATVAEFFVSGQLSGLLALRHTQKMIDSYSDHYIICGYGRVGRQVARDLGVQRAPHVVIDTNPLNRETAQLEGAAYLEGPASEDDVLIEAGITRARAVIACVDSDAENIFITLSARELRSDILIIARASAEDSEKKLLRAGADRVISPYKTSGAEMARMALHPQIFGAVEVANYRVEEIAVPASSVGAGKTVAQVRGETVIVALRRGDGSFETEPSRQAAIAPGDTVIAIGTPAALEQLEGMFQPTTVPSA
jgi:voltage-gated potassium channel